MVIKCNGVEWTQKGVLQMAFGHYVRDFKPPGYKRSNGGGNCVYRGASESVRCLVGWLMFDSGVPEDHPVWNAASGLGNVIDFLDTHEGGADTVPENATGSVPLAQVFIGSDREGIQFLKAMQTVHDEAAMNSRTGDSYNAEGFRSEMRLVLNGAAATLGMEAGTLRN